MRGHRGCDDAGMTWIWVGVFGVVALASAAQAVSGFGFALIATPLVAVLAGPREAVVGLTIVGLVLVAQALASEVVVTSIARPWC